jgi:transcriptional regulator with XRE-family HTH domain
MQTITRGNAMQSLPLREARLAAGLTAMRCAEQAATTEARLYQLERRRFRPRPDEARRLAAVLNLTVEKLFPDGVQEW